MKKPASVKSKSSVSIERDPTPGVSVGLKFSFDPKKLAPGQETMIWEHLGHLIAALFSDDPEGRSEFLRQLEAARKKGSKK